MKQAGLTLATALLVSGCTTSTAITAKRPAIKIDKPAAATPVRTNFEKRGLEAVIGKDSATLTRLFGTPRLDVVEVYGRKLQFSGKACVLDAYLYPDGKNGAEIVTHVDARRSDGAEVDRAACVDALQKR